MTARKGTFGHGMSAGGGWELTAQYLGFARGKLYPTALPASAAQPGRSQALHGSFVLRQGLRRADGPGRQAVAGRRRHQRLRDLATLADLRTIDRCPTHLPAH